MFTGNVCWILCGMFILFTVGGAKSTVFEELEEEEPLEANANEVDDPRIWLKDVNSESPAAYDAVDAEEEPEEGIYDNYPEDSPNKETESIKYENVNTKQDDRKKVKASREKALKRANKEMELTTAATPVKHTKENIAMNDIVTMTRSTKITIIASLCSIALVFVILVSAVCYLRFSTIFPPSAVEKVKGAIITIRGGNKGTGVGDPHLATGDAERAEEESEDDENEEADFTVYECEGPALAGSDMELRNPMFHSTKAEGENH